MHYRSLYLTICLEFLIGLPILCSGQVILRGIVVDSSSMQALPNVNIVVKTTGPGTVSDIRGYFELKVGEQDTIVFSRVGYFKKMLTARAVNHIVVIFLKEERRLLDEVEIEDKKPLSWLPVIPAESSWKNPTLNKVFTETPGFQGIQTFGPGYVFKGVFSQFSKEEKEKKKLIKIKEENYRARNYVSLVNDPEVKGRIMKDYLLSEDDYYRILARFNEKNRDIIYRLEEHEVIALLLVFFSENVLKNTDSNQMPNSRH